MVQFEFSFGIEFLVNVIYQRLNGVFYDIIVVQFNGCKINLKFFYFKVGELQILVYYELK